jgi:DNA repair protein RadC
VAKECPKPRRLVAKLEKSGAVLLRTRISDPRSAAEGAVKLIGDRAYEWFIAMYLNSQNCVFAYEEFTSGNIVGVEVVTSSIVRDALLAGAVGIITAHNHPSGDPDVSNQDKDLFAKLELQADVMDIKVLDHIIIGDGSFMSKSEGWKEAPI